MMQTAIMRLGGAGGLLMLAGCASFPDHAGAGRPIAIEALKPEAPRRWTDGFDDPAFAALLDRADLESLDVKVALARAAASDAAFHAARSAGRPTIDANSGWQRSIAGRERDARGVDVGALASWTPDLSGAVSAAAQAARWDVRAAGLDVDAARTLLAAELARGWIGLAAADDRLARINRRQAMESEGAALARQRVVRGLASEDEILARQTALSRLADDRLVIANEREAIRLRLLALAGLSPDDRFGAPRRLADFTVYRPATLALDQIEQRPDVMAAAARLSAADARRLAEIRNARPRVVLSLAGQGGNMNLANFFTNPGFGLVPAIRLEGAIFDGGRSRARADRSAAEAAEAEAAYRKAIVDASRDLATALAALMSADERQAPAAEALRLARARLVLVGARFARGTASRIDEIDAERAFFDAEEAEAEARRALISAGVETRAALLGGR